MSRLQAVIERRAHAARPSTRALDGDELLADLMARLANDACQRTPVEPMGRGYVDDPDAMKAMRFLLRCLEAA